MPAAASGMIYVCCGVGAGSQGKRHAKSCDPVDRTPVLPRSTPILSPKARAELAKKAMRRYAAIWLRESGNGAHIVGEPILVNLDTGNSHLIKQRIEIYILRQETK